MSVFTGAVQHCTRRFFMFMLFNFSLQRSTYYINLGHDITQFIFAEHVFQDIIGCAAKLFSASASG